MKEPREHLPSLRSLSRDARRQSTRLPWLLDLVRCLPLRWAAVVAALFVAAVLPRGASGLERAPGALHVDLWSDPGPGAVVRPGDRARLYFQPNDDCFVTVVSVDTEGRLRLLFPPPSESGWVQRGRVRRLPAGASGHDLLFAGPPGIEYVYAIASPRPMRPHFPVWFACDNSPAWVDYEDFHDEDPYETGWIMGDPFLHMRTFARHLLVDVPYEATSMAYIHFYLGRTVSYPRYVCGDCHARGVDPYGATCAAVTMRVGDIPCTGWIDFRIVFVPRFTYVVRREWRPRGWCGTRWDGPDGRWVWSSSDGRKRMRECFHPRERSSERDDWTDRRENGKKGGGKPGVRHADNQGPGRGGWGRVADDSEFRLGDLPGSTGGGGRNASARGGVEKPERTGSRTDDLRAEDVGGKPAGRREAVRPVETNRPEPARAARPPGRSSNDGSREVAQPPQRGRNGDSRGEVRPSRESDQENRREVDRQRGRESRDKGGSHPREQENRDTRKSESGRRPR